MKLVASAIIVLIAITSSSAFSFSIVPPSVRVTIESGAFAAGVVKSVADAAGNVVHGISAAAATLANNTANLKAEIIAIVKSYEVDPSKITDAMESSASDAINSLIAYVNNIEFAIGMVASFEKQIGIQLRVNVAAYIAQITVKQGAAKCWDASKDALNQTSSDLAKQLNELAANETASLKAQLQGLDSAATTEIKLQLESGANNQCANATTSSDKQACLNAYFIKKIPDIANGVKEYVNAGLSMIAHAVQETTQKSDAIIADAASKYNSINTTILKCIKNSSIF